MKFEQIESALLRVLIAIGTLAILMFAWEIGKALYRATSPTFTAYKIELQFCDGRKEVRDFITTGHPPSIRNDRRALPEFGFDGGGANSPRVLNVCDFSVIEKRVVND